MPVSRSVREVIGKAITDEKFRDTLFNNQEEALKGFTLDDDERAAIASLNKSQIEEAASNVGGAAAWKVGVEVTIHF